MHFEHDGHTREMHAHAMRGTKRTPRGVVVSVGEGLDMQVAVVVDQVHGIFDMPALPSGPAIQAAREAMEAALREGWVVLRGGVRARILRGRIIFDWPNHGLDHGLD